MTDFDAKAREWDTDPLKWERAQTVAREICAHIPIDSQMCVLEYGCGTGLLSFAMKDAVASIDLADPSNGMIEVLREKIRAQGIRHMRPILLGPAGEGLSGERYDLITSLMTLHHIPDVHAALQLFSRLVSPGGWIALADLDAEDGSFHGPDDLSVHRGFVREELAKWAEASGFTALHFSTVFRMLRNDRMYPVFLMVGRNG